MKVANVTNERKKILVLSDIKGIQDHLLAKRLPDSVEILNTTSKVFSCSAINFAFELISLQNELINAIPQAHILLAGITPNY